MDRLTRDEVLHVAKLSKLSLIDQEVDLFSKQLSEVVNYFKELSHVDTKNVEPTHQTTGLHNVYRADNVTPQLVLDVNEATREASNTYNNFFVVPRLIDDKI